MYKNTFPIYLNEYLYQLTFEMSISLHHYYLLMLSYKVYQYVYSNIIFHIIRIQINSIKLLYLAQLSNSRGRASCREGEVCDLRIPYEEIKGRKGL